MFITFERIDGDSVWLRLFNNMSCGIVARSGDLSSKQYEHLFKSRESKTPAGETLTEYIFVWPAEGVVAVPIVYNLEGKRVRNELNPDNQQFEDHIYTFPIPPERSVKFSVFADHFRSGFDISVPLPYEWEAGFDVEPVKHQAVFFNSQIPKGVFQKLIRHSDENR